MPRPVPYDTPTPVILSVRQLDALDALLADDHTATRYETILNQRGLDCDAAEDEYEALRATLRRGMESAQRRADARPVTPRVQLRCVTAAGTVVVGGHAYFDRALAHHRGRMVRCTPEVVGAMTVCRIETTDREPICVAEPLKTTPLRRSDLAA